MMLPLLGLMNAAMYAPVADMMSIDTKLTLPAAPWMLDPLRSDMAMKPDSNPTMAPEICSMSKVVVIGPLLVALMAHRRCKAARDRFHGVQQSLPFPRPARE